MSKRMWMAVIVLTVPVALAACGGDDKGSVLGPGGGSSTGTPVPQEMIGLWAMTLTISDCAGLDSYTDTDTFSVCPGDYVEGNDDPRNCSVSQDGNTVRSTCETSYEQNGCRVTERSTGTSTVSGNQFDFSAELEISYAEACGYPSWCLKLEGTGRKIGPAPNPCDSSGEFGSRIPGMSDRAIGGIEGIEDAVVQARTREAMREALLRH